MMTARQYYQAAWKLFDADKFDESAAKVREGLSLHPASADLWMALIANLNYSGRHEEVLGAFRKYEELGGASGTARVMYGKALQNTGKKLESLAVYKQLAKSRELGLWEGCEAMKSLNRLSQEQEFHRPASRIGLRLARRLAKAHPTEVEPLFGIGFWLGTLGRMRDKALALMAQALKRSPERHDYRRCYASLLYETGRAKEAFREWCRIPLEEVTSEGVLVGLAKFHERHGRQKKAAACRRQAYALRQQAAAAASREETDPEIIAEEAIELFREGQHLEAAGLLRRHLETNPGAVILWEALLHNLACAREYGGALRAFERYRELGGADALAQVRYAQALAAVGRKSEAKRAYRVALSNPNLAPDVGSALLDGIHDLKDTELGLQAALQLAEMHPRVAEFHFAVGYWMFQAEAGLTNALPHVRTAVKLSPGNPPYRSFLANLLYDLGRKREAMRHWEQIPIRQHGCLTTLGRMAEMYTTLGQKRKAETCRRRLKSLEKLEDPRAVLADDALLHQVLST